MAQAEAIARARIAAINRPAAEAAARARESAARQADSERLAAERAFAANVRIIDDLSRQFATFGDERRQFVDQALSRLSDGATSAQRAEVERLASALFDERQTREQLAETMRQEERVREEGARLIAATRTPAEQLAETIARLDELMRAGAIDAETHGRALADAYAQAEDAADRALRASREWQDGVTRGLRDYAAEATDAASHAEQVMNNAFQGMEDALVAFVQTGKLDFRSLVDSIMADLTRIAVRESITGPLAGLLSGGGGAAAGAAGGTSGGGLFAGLGTFLARLFHEGGIAGETGVRSRMVDPAIFLAAPRYHAGGVAGLQPDEIPAILRRGEAVLTEKQMSAMGDKRQGADGGRPVTVVMNITTPDAGGFRKSQGQIAAEAARAMDRARRNL